MGIFDFFKKKEVIEKQNAKFENIDKLIEDKNKEFEKEEKEIITKIEKIFNELKEKLKENQDILKKIDLSEKKSEEKIKKIVEDGLISFNEKLDDFIIRLNNLEYSNLSEFCYKIESSFKDFEKKSFMSFEKANILVGKELGNIKESITNFYKEFNIILKENQEKLSKFKTLEKIKIIKKEISNFEGVKDNLNKIIKNFDEKINKDEEKINKLNKEIKEIENSKEYKENLLKKSEITEKNNEISKHLSELRKLINFKELANNFHTIERDMELIKKYKDNFVKTFEEDKGIFFIENIQDENIEGKINKLNKIKESISETIIKEDKTIEIKKQINILQEEINKFNDERLKYEKKIYQSDKEIEILKNKIIEEFKKLNILIT